MWETTPTLQSVRIGSMLEAWPRSAWSSVPTDAKTGSETDSDARECHEVAC